MMIERLRIDIEDLNLSAIKSLMGLPYLAIGKHLCGPAIDKRFIWNMGIGEDEFHAITWLTSWAVDADHSLLYSDGLTQELRLHIIEAAETPDEGVGKVEELVKKTDAMDRALLGFMCRR